jgi:hypothetical protein
MYFYRYSEDEQKYVHGGRLKFNILFYGNNSWIIALSQTKLGIMTDHRPTSFIRTVIFFKWSFEYGDGGTCKLLRWIRNLHQSTCNHEIKTIFTKTKKYEHGFGYNLKFTFYFMETTHEPLHLRQMKFVHLKIMDMLVD